MKSSAALALLFAGVSTLQAQLVLNTFPSREYGQLSLTSQSGSPNLLEGREFANPQSVALDRSVTPPILYVVDTSNNRVLGWRNATAAGAGTTADLAIGQTDRTSSLANGGPNSPFSGGLTAPTGVAVDGSGNVYVIDAANNRILRYPKPFQQLDQQAERIQPDLVIGQASLRENSPGTTERNIATNPNGQIFQSNLAFDSAGNLWTTDPANNRVLRFPASALQAGQPNGPAADVVLGQVNFTSNTAPSSVQDKSKLAAPSGLAFDAAGRLFVADGGNRVLVYIPTGTNFITGQNASRIMGIVIPPQGQRPPTISEQTLGAVLAGNRAAPPTSVFTVGNIPYVVDTGNNRILRYDPYDQWPAEATQFSPSARAVYGQSNDTDFTGNKINKGQAEPSSSSLNSPTSAAVGTNEVYVVDNGNNRVLVFPLSGSNMAFTASRVIGQLDFPFFAPNLVEGRELFLQNGSDGNGFRVAGGMAVDRRSNPPRLYVADTWNNRVLGFKDARNVKPGDKADIVIGQVDFNRTLTNSPGNDGTLPTETGLNRPTGVTVDAAGNLYIADYGNGRVLRYPTPFSQQQQRPNLVIGQASFTSARSDPDSRTLARPYGVVLDVDGDLLVSDAGFNRVLFFRKPAGGDLTNGQAAEKVFGQPDFFSIAAGASQNRMSSPRGIAVDTDNRLYVADTGNGRVSIFNFAPGAGIDPSPAVVLTGLNAPHSVFVSFDTGEIWVANTSGNNVLRYPRFDLLALSRDPNTTIQSGTPLAVTLDPFGNLLVAEGINRILFYYPGTQPRDGAAFTPRPLSAGGYATLFPVTGARFVEQTATASSLPYPKELGDVQVLINDTPSPLAYTSPTQINFIVPNSVPSSGSVDLVVLQVSTGRVLAATRVPLAQATPALFTTGGTTQIAATNEDGSVNTPANGVVRGRVVTLYGTGYGFVKGAPADGEAPGKAVPIELSTRVIIDGLPNGADYLPDANILYSGLSPQYPGLWQINVKIPENTNPGQRQVVVQIGGSFFSNDSGSGQRLQTFITVKDR